MKRTDIIKCEGRTFELVTVMDAFFHGMMADVHIYEVVRPNWPIFRTRWLDTRNFWIDDFPTIEAGVHRMLQRVLEAEAEAKMTNNKWDEFLNK